MGSEKNNIAVAMSGGVDSTMAAVMLAEHGYQIIGVYLNLWKAFKDQKLQNKIKKHLDRISKHLGFDIIILNAESEFKEHVINYFNSALQRNLTPNPCIICNRQIKFGFLMQRMHQHGFEFIATGHYVKKRENKNGLSVLYKAKDRSKDQSYYLCWLQQSQLQRSIFPLGDAIKKDVIQKIRDLNLEFENQKESQDLCFLSDNDYRKYIQKYIPTAIRKGEIYNTNDRCIGTHQGLAFYTIGQRKGIGISSNKPLYVIDKIPEKNRLIVGELSELGRKKFFVEKMNWICKTYQHFPKIVSVKIRYRAKPVKALIEKSSTNLDSIIKVRLFKKLRDITPGQFAVFYHKDIVLGGGIIKI